MGTSAILDMRKLFQKLDGLTSPAVFAAAQEGAVGRPGGAIPMAGSILV